MARPHGAPINGSAVRDFRLLKRWTVAQLADRSGCKPAHLSNIEVGTRGASVELTEALADALGVRVESILRDTIGTPSRAGQKTAIRKVAS